MLTQQANADIEEFLKATYKQICGHLIAGNLPMVKELLQISFLGRSYSARAAGVSALLGEPPAITEDLILSRIETARVKLQSGNVRLPGLETLYADSSLNAANLRGKKVLTVMRRYFFNNGREHEIPQILSNSLKEAGIAHSSFPLESLSATNGRGGPESYVPLDDLVKQVVQERPDLILFDHLCDDPDRGPLSYREMLRQILLRLKASTGVKVAGLYLDSWPSETLEAISFVRSFADVIWHQNSKLLVPSNSELTGKAQLFYSPIPYSLTLIERNSQNREIESAFVGGLAVYNLPRGIWLSLIKLHQLPCENLLSSHGKSGNAAGNSLAEYFNFLSRIKTMVNFTARTPSLSIMMGRTWESILSGCLLLEEDNPETRNFLIPYAHYVPFQTIQELSALLQFFRKNDDLRQEIFQASSAWRNKWYRPEMVWTALFRKANII